MRSTLRCSHRASALTVAPSMWIGTYSIFCTPGKFEEEIIEELEKKIWKFHRRNPNCGATLNISDPYSLRRSNFNDRYPTVIFIHGYSESATGRSAVTIRDGTFTVIFNYNSYIIIIGYYRSSRSILKEKRQERNVCSSVKSNSPRLRKSV